MTWCEGDRWTSEVNLSPGSYDFKLVIARQDGSVAAWEPDENRSVTVSLFMQATAQRKQDYSYMLSASLHPRVTSRLMRAGWYKWLP